MIRINLLAESRRRSRLGSADQIWVGIYAVAIVAWVGTMLGLYVTMGSEFDEKTARNAALTRKVKELEEGSAGLEEVRAKLKKSKELEAVVQKLNKARTGPVRVLMEISAILSKGGGPTVDPVALEKLRRDNPRAGFARGWDTRRLWLISFEEERRSCRIKGVGRTNEDVAEFLQRLALSELFEEVTLEKTQADKPKDSELPVIEFELSAKVRY